MRWNVPIQFSSPKCAQFAHVRNTKLFKISYKIFLARLLIIASQLLMTTDIYDLFQKLKASSIKYSTIFLSKNVNVDDLPSQIVDTETLFSNIMLCLIKISYLYVILQSSRCPYKVLLPFTAFLIAPLTGARLPLTVLATDFAVTVYFPFFLFDIKVMYLNCPFWRFHIFSANFDHRQQMYFQQKYLTMQIIVMSIYPQRTPYLKVILKSTFLAVRDVEKNRGEIIQEYC